MTRLLRTGVLSFAFLLEASLFGGPWAQSSLPELSGAVNDFADVIAPPYEKRISNLAKELFAKTGVALVLVTIQDLGGADPNEYAHRLYDASALGKTGGDQGALILVSVGERKLLIHTGTGLKAILSPRRIGEIQDRFVAPLLKQNNYDDGLLNGVVATAKIIAKESGVRVKGIEP